MSINSTCLALIVIVISSVALSEIEFDTPVLDQRGQPYVPTALCSHISKNFIFTES